MKMGTTAMAASAAKKHKAKMNEAVKETKKQANLFGNVMSKSWQGSKILMHNGLICLVYGPAMFIVCYAAVQLAMVVVALLIGATGVVAMELVTDVLTAYTIIVMSCGFCLFASFAVIKMLARAAKRRLWHTDRATGGIDKGPAWRERHEFDKKED